ncbi:MAG: prepilin peptidase, partial [Candidatus Wallbacteria bacterium]|nr:prepilin peptidase [Candidatus Wallbacteria bacterium]
MLPEWFIYGNLIVFSLLIGSFINVCIYRLPLSRSIVFPSSHCTNCRSILKPAGRHWGRHWGGDIGDASRYGDIGDASRYSIFDPSTSSTRNFRKSSTTLEMVSRLMLRPAFSNDRQAFPDKIKNII